MTSHRSSCLSSFLFILLLPSLLLSGEFTATVSRNQVTLGDSFSLNLTLKETSAKSTPSIEMLKNSFVVNSQQQSSNTVINNGHVTSSTTWKYVLIPQKEGEVSIPSLNIDTAEGTLSSNPITIRVVKGSGATGSDVADSLGVTLVTDVSDAKPYKNEPFLYTIRLTSDKPLVNVSMQKMSVDDAIIEADGEPKVYESVVNGVNYGIIEFSYLITPLKAGPLNLHSVVIQGGIQTKRKPHPGSFFDDHSDPFSMMLGFDRLKPFALSTEETVIEVQSPIAGINPWLPAKALKIEEVWDDSQRLQAGDPFTRGFKIVAEGVKSSQLPSLQELHIGSPSLKIYADKPELEDTIKDGSILSQRNEQYTMIPQQSGQLILPEIAITWWDVSKNAKAVARVPARTLSVLPTIEALPNAKIEAAADASLAVPEQHFEEISRDPIYYLSMGGLAILLIVAIFWGISLQRKIAHLTESQSAVKIADKRPIHPKAVPAAPMATPAKNKTDKKEKLPNLNPT